MSKGPAMTSVVTVEPFLVEALAALFDNGLPVPQPGEPLPPYWHLAACARPVATSLLGPDGHPRTGVITPPDDLPRRMFAGGSLSIERSLRVGERVEQQAFVEETRNKVGRSGPLRFVTVALRAVAEDSGVTHVERQRLVYRGAAVTGASDASPRPAPARREQLVALGPGSLRGTLCADSVALQRFSAVTSNAHRIHYDRPYAMTVEGYPDLVVHGPLVLLSLLELVRSDSPGRQVADVDFTASSPVFCGDEVSLIGAPDGDTVTLQAQVGDRIAMTATVTLVPV